MRDREEAREKGSDGDGGADGDGERREKGGAQRGMRASAGVIAFQSGSCAHLRQPFWDGMLLQKSQTPRKL